MLQLLQKNKEKIPLIGDMLFSTLIFPFTIPLLEKWMKTPEDPGFALWILTLYAVMAVMHLFRAFRLGRKSKLIFISQLAYAFIFAACAVIMPIFGYNRTTFTIVSLAFWGRLLVDRIISIIRLHKPLNNIGNGIAILMILFFSLSAMTEFSMVIVVPTASFSSLISILAVSFSQIKIGILKEIIRKTYASQIILGMLLTMVAFSYALVYFDESFTSIFDALWYCFAVVTTIGFGDFTPVSALGRIISVILGIYGIIVVALITSIIVNFYGEMKKTDLE